ncbi:Acetyltransferase (isoleucine patch superfamily) [Chishuiella changwenlii]|uniref:Acetyltransferase (Isoleucine patch superfamily) n=1 Tax=Chishuiella changwenlii TaxID=1434701 RepID=A0A1M7A5V3_9FLAO|nr:CatB-related O-acetyltransferase [Chishuiella changwenlii]GGF10252.1 hypothetical protein GCM10010984_29260 [Chishuiella changwenlii]SHL38033.1 Acetyltransferase (isoleucine patch superfamily) [Chishuiella changwenlii]
MIILLKVLNSIRVDIIIYLKKKYKIVKWRSKNKHNSIVIETLLKNYDMIKVGNNSYGNINVESFENEIEGLVIGNYVSIASGVKFILGGNHQINTFTSYPLKSSFIEKTPSVDAKSKGKIIVDDEVWIGNGVIVLSGVTIGKGAIIAAGSVVTKDVKPFSIVGGNPAKFIKYRFSENLIKLREDVDINDISKEKFIDNINLFYEDLSTDILSKIKNIEKS